MPTVARAADSAGGQWWVGDSPSEEVCLGRRSLFDSLLKICLSGKLRAW